MLVAIHDTPEALTVRPWPDSVLDQIGHDPRSPYVERTGAVEMFEARVFAVSSLRLGVR